MPIFAVFLDLQTNPLIKIQFRDFSSKNFTLLKNSLNNNGVTSNFAFDSPPVYVTDHVTTGCGKF